MQKHNCTLNASHDSLFHHKTRWQQFLGSLGNFILVSEKNPRTILYFRSQSEIMKERRRQLMVKTLVVHPLSEFRIYFELIMLVLFLVHLISTPWEMFLGAIYRDEMSSHAQTYILFSSIMNVVHIIIAFYTGYIEEITNSIILVPKKIRRNYITSALFYFDLVATIPIELIIHNIPYIETESIIWMQSLRLTRLCRLPTTIIYMNNAADLYNITTITYRSIRYTIITTLILHWTGCMTAIISKYFYSYSPIRSSQNWVRQAAITSTSHKFESYVKTLFRTIGCMLGVTHGQYPNLTLEDELMAALIFITGFFLCAFLLILMLQMLISSSLPEMMNVAFLSELDDYMERTKMNSEQRNKLLEYYKYQFRHNSLYDSTTLNMLSEQLHREIIKFSYRGLVSNFKILEHFSHDVIDKMLDYMEKDIYLRGEYIVKTRQIDNNIYFIVNGTVSVKTFLGLEVSHLHEGSYFGEIALADPSQQRQADVIALETCEICILSHENLLKCVDTTSKAYVHLLEEGKRRWAFLRVMNDTAASTSHQANLVRRLSTIHRRPNLGGLL